MNAHALCKSRPIDDFCRGHPRDNGGGEGTGERAKERIAETYHADLVRYLARRLAEYVHPFPVCDTVSRFFGL